MNNLSTKEIQSLDTMFKYTKPPVKLGGKLKEIIDDIDNIGNYKIGTPVNAVNASKVLSITGVVKDGETVTMDNPSIIGFNTYEFAADVALRVGLGNIPVDINSVTVKATNTLTLDTNPTSGDTMTIGTKVFTFVPFGTANADGEIAVETLLADTKINIIAAIMGTDGHNTAHTLVNCGVAFVDDVLSITALVGGTAGNDIATTETFTANSNVFSAAKLATGADCTAANAVTALVSTITTSDTQGIAATDGVDDTVVITANIAGVSGNSIVIGETLTNGSFAGDATLLSGGIDGTVAGAGETKIDTSYLYTCVADNTVAGKNWRRITLGSAY